MKNKSLFENACTMWALDAKALQSLNQLIDPDEYQAVFDAILTCKGRVATMGMGTSSIAAKKIAHMLCVANVPSTFVSPGDAAHGALGAVQAGDVVIVISKGGNTEELVNLIDSLKKKKATLISVTQNPDSLLGKAADILLCVTVKESDHKNMLPTASILSIIAIFDAIADELTKQPQFSEEIFYLNHNHGAVGALLKDRANKK